MPYLVLGQLDLTSLQVYAEGPGASQLLSSAGQPGVELVQGVLELTQAQQGTLQLVLKPQTITTHQTSGAKTRGRDLSPLREIITSSRQFNDL